METLENELFGTKEEQSLVNGKMADVRIIISKNHKQRQHMIIKSDMEVVLVIHLWLFLRYYLFRKRVEVDHFYLWDIVHAGD